MNKLLLSIPSLVFRISIFWCSMLLCCPLSLYLCLSIVLFIFFWFTESSKILFRWYNIKLWFSFCRIDIASRWASKVVSFLYTFISSGICCCSHRTSVCKVLICPHNDSLINLISWVSTSVSIIRCSCVTCFSWDWYSCCSWRLSLSYEVVVCILIVVGRSWVEPQI